MLRESSQLTTGYRQHLTHPRRYTKMPNGIKVTGRSATFGQSDRTRLFFHVFRKEAHGSYALLSATPLHV